MNYCAIDFGTSNSAVAVADATGATRLVPLEGGHPTMPTAVFHDTETNTRLYGRAAVAAYVEGHPGRLMRSLKSILGSALIDQTTQMGDGVALKYIDVVAAFLHHLKTLAESHAGTALSHVVLGRPVRFVDDDPIADARAEAALADAARSVGFAEVSFELEPIAAALDYGRTLDRERLVLVADIGGGTSDFTVIRVGDRAREVLATHGVHVAGTDFDQRVELDALLPLFGFRGRTPEGRETPHGVYFDLATWHLINGLYGPRRTAELKGMRWFYADPAHFRRLMTVIDERLGHHLLACAEDAKIALSDASSIEVDLGLVETGLHATVDRALLDDALDRPLAAIVDAAHETVRRAGVTPSDLHALYFTGGSTGLRILTDRLTAGFPGASAVIGDRFSSVAAGLGIEAARRFGPGR